VNLYGEATQLLNKQLKPLLPDYMVLQPRRQPSQHEYAQIQKKKTELLQITIVMGYE
jgi:hypothetical protein